MVSLRWVKGGDGNSFCCHWHRWKDLAATRILASLCKDALLGALIANKIFTRGLLDPVLECRELLLDLLLAVLPKVLNLEEYLVVRFLGFFLGARIAETI